MAIERRSDISREPKFPIIVFGDGLMARIISKNYDVDSTGTAVWRVVLLPTPELAKEYDITIDMMDENQTLVKMYPQEYIVALNQNPNFPVYICFQTFDGKESEAMQYFEGKIQIDRLMSLKKINRILKAENAYLTEQLELSKTNVRRFIKDEVMGAAGEFTNQILSTQLNNQTSPVSPVRQNVG